MMMSREDIAIIFPEHRQFILGMRLFKFIQDQRQVPSSSSGSCGSNAGSISEFGSSTSKRVHPEEFDDSLSTVQQTQQKAFKLPCFSRDIEEAIRRDEFYTSSKRSKLIREACRALQGHCRSLHKSVSTNEKKSLARSLYVLAPKSLGDPTEIGVKGVPEVRCILK
jgi:hypothetical protein